MARTLLSAPDIMRRLACVTASLLLATSALSLAGCVSAGDSAEGIEDLGDIGDGKADSFGIVDKSTYINAHKSRTYTFTANAAFRLAITQPNSADDQILEVTLTRPDGSAIDVASSTEPSAVDDGTVASGTYSLTITNTGDKRAYMLINVRPLAAFGDLPNPNADIFPELDWQPPALAEWPSTYVIFNNPGCGRACTQAQSTEMQPRSVMIKMLVAAIHEVKEGGTVRVSNFNISGSASVKPVVDALLWAMQNRNATVKIVMDEGQNNATSRTTQLAAEGAQVRFLDGIHYTNSVGPAVGIMHSKIVVVDDQVVFTGSNNFSSTGFITNEENSVVLRAPANASRIAAFTCDVDTMFDVGVEPGQPQKTDDERRDAILALDSCNTEDVFFPPTGALATGDSVAYDAVYNGIKTSKQSLAFAPDMFAHPALVSAILSRAKRAKTAGEPYAVKMVLDASDEALHNPAFGDCLEVGARKYGLDIQVKYWHGTPEIFQLNHHKFMIVDADVPDGATLYNGSANYSAKALKWSFENVTRYTSAEFRPITDAFAARFQTMFAEAQTKDELRDAGLDVPNCPLSESSL
jgi:HKD family nuclease